MEKVMEFFVAKNFIFYDIKYRLIQKFGGIILVGLYFIPGLKYSKKLEILMASHRASYSSFSEKLIKKNLQRITNLVSPSGQASEKIKKEILDRSIILKKPLEKNGKVIEKGIILITFSETFALYLRYVDCENVMSDYHLVLEPSWTGHAIAQILGWCKFKEKVYIQCADKPDFDFINSLQSNLVPIRIGSGEFVDYRIFQPMDSEKKYELISIANGQAYKRVYAYLKLVKSLKDKNPNVRAALVCANRGALIGKIPKLIDLLGLQSSIDYFIDLTQKELSKVIEQSKINILMSYREGASRVLFEAIFSGTPSVIVDRNIGIRKECFTKDSGLVAREKFLVQDIECLLSRVSSLRPREWALKNISPEVSLEKIVNLILSTEYKMPSFQNQIYYKVNSPEAIYMHSYTDISKPISDGLVSEYINSHH